MLIGFDRKFEGAVHKQSNADIRNGQLLLPYLFHRV